MEKEYIFSLRNDGSKESICSVYDNSYSNKLLDIPDGGFFVEVPDYKHPEFTGDYIAINVATDCWEERFGNKETKKEFIDNMARFVNKICLLHNTLRVVFVPHIFSDYMIINEKINGIDDKILRTQISCAPCYSGLNSGGLYNFDIYKKAKIVIGMRYHANVCSIGMRIPTIGIGSFDKVYGVYNDCGLNDRVIMVRDAAFYDKLYEKVLIELENPDDFIRQNVEVMNKLTKRNEDYFDVIKKIWR